MLKRSLVLALLTIACGHHAPAPPVPPPATWRVDAIACATAGPVPYACAQPIPGATIQMHGPDGYLSQPGDDAGYAVFTLPAGFTDSDVIIDAPEYLTARAHIDVAGTHDSPRHNIILMTSVHVDPSKISLGQLAAIRGAMWTARLNLPYGPRPNQDDNILAMAFYEVYGATDRRRMLARYHDVDGYTHAVTGPITGNDCYHGQYPCRQSLPTQAEWEAYLDTLQEWWDAGVAPIFFAHPDGWSFEATRDALTPLLEQPRAQKLIRIVVPSGWEPTRYDWSSCTWAAFARWGRETLPNALILIHTVSDVDAPVGTDARCDDNGRSNGEGWARVTPFLHGWLAQSGAFADPSGHGDPNHPERTNFENWTELFDPNARGSYQDRFQHGYAGWPTFSAWGNAPLRVYAGEYASYWSYWNNRPESEAQDWGDAAMRSGADGYLDGGRVPVRPRLLR